MPKHPTKSSSICCYRLHNFIKSFREIIVKKCAICTKHNCVCKVYICLEKCSKCVCCSQQCNVCVTKSKFKRLAAEKEKLRTRIRELQDTQKVAIAAQEKALKDLCTAQAKALEDLCVAQA
jgi:hypothetical protein